MKAATIRTKLKSIIPSVYLDEIAKGLIEVENYLIEEGCRTSDKFLGESLVSLVKAGGKRLRPILTLLCGFAGEFDRKKLVPAAVAVEIIHTASLVHDDIIDGAEFRRGKMTLEKRKGRLHAVSAGDYLFARAFELLASLKEVDAIDILTRAAVDLSLGELDGHFFRRKFTLRKKDYFVLIGRKTASLFSAACRLGTRISGAPEREAELLASFGWFIGLAFQAYDDILDVIGNEADLGKPAGSDLREGFLTLPYLIAMEEGRFVQEMKKVVRGETSEKFVKEVVLKIRQTDIIEKAMKEARNLIEKALESIRGISNPDLESALENIGSYVIQRYS